MTPIGYFFVPLAFFCFFLRPERLLSLLVFASVFEASSVFNSAIGSFELGIPPFYVVEVFIALQLVALTVRTGKLLPSADDPRRQYISALLFFWAWACASGFILPHVFSGMPVYEPRGGIDEQYEALTPLRWSFSNLAQVLYLSLNVCALIYATRVVTKREVTLLLRTLGIAVAVAVAVGGIQWIASVQGWRFPYDVLNNNPGYSQGFEQSVGDVQRITSTFTEASFAGSFLGAVAIGLIAAFLRGRRTLSWLLAAVTTFLVLLGTNAMNGYVAFAIVLCMLFACFPPFRGPIQTRRFLAKGWMVLVAPLLAATGLVLVAFPNFAASALTVTSQKSDTLSFLHRLYSDLTALNIFLDTWGMGVGLGSNRPSSMLMAFLSTVGIVGTVLFALFLIRVVRAFPGKSASGMIQWTFWSLVGLLIAQLIAVPDMNRPVLWTLIILVVVQLDTSSGRIPGHQLTAAIHNLLPRGPARAPALGTELRPGEGTAG